MRPYEVMVIFDTGTEPPAVQAMVDRVLETIRSGGGSPGTVDRWGRRSLAYELNHKREGYYVLVEFAAEPAALPALDRLLSLADDVIRHKVVRLPDAAPRPEVAAGRPPATGSGGQAG